jgi:sterol desaturase/sphingolipid hydroxylase (fatty acid hydroxylase superfamily)
MNEWIQWFIDRSMETVFASFLSWSSFAEALVQIPLVFVDLGNGLAWPYLLSSLALAWMLYQAARISGWTPAASFREFAFPARLYSHPSTALDWRFMAIDLFLTFLLYVPIMTGFGLLGTKVVSTVLGWLSWQPPQSLSPSAIVGTAMGFLLLNDFLLYWAHVLFHKVPVLWAFHQVHHSAEVLTPAAAYRMHPVEVLSAALFKAPAVGLAAVFYQNIIGPDRAITMVFGVSIVGFVLALLGTHLRHSHIWFSFGPLLNRVFMSPAHHQIHHSIEARHWNTNFAVKLALWDALFGTLYLPRSPETFRIGLPEGECNDFKTVSQLYAVPFVKAVRVVNRLRGAENRGWITGFVPPGLFFKERR